MVLNGTFGSTRNNQDFLDTRRNSFFHNKLNNRLIYNREHFLGKGFSCWQEACSIACRRNDSFSNFLHEESPILLDQIARSCAIQLERLDQEYRSKPH